METQTLESALTVMNYLFLITGITIWFALDVATRFWGAVKRVYGKNLIVSTTDRALLISQMFTTAITFWIGSGSLLVVGLFVAAISSSPLTGWIAIYILLVALVSKMQAAISDLDWDELFKAL